MNIGNGPGYNYILNKQKDMSDSELVEISNRWDKTNLTGKILSTLNIFSEVELKSQVASDIIESRYNPNGETAGKICWKMDSYRERLRG